MLWIESLIEQVENACLQTRWVNSKVSVMTGDRKSFLGIVRGVKHVGREIALRRPLESGLKFNLHIPAGVVKQTFDEIPYECIIDEL